MDEMQAAILFAKLKYLQEENNRRRKIANIYDSILNNENIRNYDIAVKSEIPIKMEVNEKSIDKIYSFKYTFNTKVGCQTRQPHFLFKLKRQEKMSRFTLSLTKKYYNQSAEYWQNGENML